MGDLRLAARACARPGEEDAVGLGTLTSVARGYRADGAVILEPTENIPRRASRGGCRFEIECRGRAVHGTAKWLGVDAIGRMRRVFDALDRMEAAWNDRAADPCFAAYPITRPITVDEVHGGAWQGMVCDACSCAGYLELLPNDDLESWQRGFCERLRAELGGTDGGPEALTIRFSEQYRGHCTDAANPIWEAACGAMESFGGPAGDLIGAPAGFNAGCEAGLRAALHGTPTLVWGPGSLAHAHAPDEFIEFAEVRRGALQFLELIRRWSSQEAL